MDPYPDDKDLKYEKLDNKRRRHWRMVFEDNDGGMDNKKAILHDKRWDVYMNEK